MRIIDKPNEIALAQAKFVRTINDLSKGTRSVTIGFQSGNIKADVMWLAELGIWAFFGDPPNEKSPGERYWNVFGIGEPHGMVPITCEINPPKEGINRQAAGAFSKDGSENIYLLHRGIFNSHGRIPKTYIRNNFPWKWTTVDDGERASDVMLIGLISSTEFPQILRDFILEVAKLKNRAQNR